MMRESIILPLKALHRRTPSTWPSDRSDSKPLCSSSSSSCCCCLLLFCCHCRCCCCCCFSGSGAGKVHIARLPQSSDHTPHRIAPHLWRGVRSLCLRKLAVFRGRGHGGGGTRRLSLVRSPRRLPSAKDKKKNTHTHTHPTDNNVKSSTCINAVRGCTQPKHGLRSHSAS